MEDKNCGTCAAWFKTGFGEEWIEGRCRHSPPKVFFLSLIEDVIPEIKGVTLWPKTFKSDWCCKWFPKKT